MPNGDWDVESGSNLWPVPNPREAPIEGRAGINSSANPAREEGPYPLLGVLPWSIGRLPRYHEDNPRLLSKSDRD
jgi:hypothetical protein